MGKIKPENSIATAKLIDQYSEELRVLAEKMEFHSKEMQQNGIGAVGPVAVSSIERGIETVRSAVTSLATVAEKAVIESKRRKASEPQGTKPTPEAKAGASVAKLIVKREKSPSSE